MALRPPYLKALRSHRNHGLQVPGGAGGPPCNVHTLSLSLSLYRPKTWPSGLWKSFTAHSKILRKCSKHVKKLTNFREFSKIFKNFSKKSKILEYLLTFFEKFYTFRKFFKILRSFSKILKKNLNILKKLLKCLACEPFWQPWGPGLGAVKWENSLWKYKGGWVVATSHGVWHKDSH